MKRMGIILILLSLLITPVMASGGLQISPAVLNKDGVITVTNTGDRDTTYITSLSQVMLKDGNQVIIDDVKADVQISEAEFTLKPGESKEISVTIGNTDGKLYGVRISTVPVEGQFQLSTSLICKIDGGQPTAIVKDLQVTPKFLPVTLSGVSISVTYQVVNNGNIMGTIEGKNFYPGDSGNVVKEYPTGLFDFGFNEYGGHNVFVIPSPLVAVVLLAGMVLYLRRKVDVKLK